MRRILLSLAILSTACSSGSHYPATDLPVDSQLISSSVDLKITTEICIITNTVDPSWNLTQAVDQWNINSKNLFSFNQTGCDAKLFFTDYRSDKYWAETDFYNIGTIDIYLSNLTPADKRFHTMCHELGHVLGLAHNNNPESCMNVYSLSTQPTKEDLREAGSDLWEWAKASRRMHGE